MTGHSKQSAMWRNWTDVCLAKCSLLCTMDSYYANHYCSHFLSV